MSEKMRKSIRGKLITMALTIAMLIIILLTCTTYWGFVTMRTNNEIINNDIIEVASDFNEETLRVKSMNELANLAQASAVIVDSRLDTIMYQLNILGEALEMLYENPENYGRIKVNPPSIDDAGEYVAQLSYDTSTDYSLIADEVELLGNLSIIMNQITSTIPEITSTYIGTASGFTIICDQSPELKVDADFVIPSSRPSYIVASENAGVAWTEVFDDAYGRGFAATCGYPVYSSNGELLAVVAIGCTLVEISNAIIDINIGETGQVVVINRQGEIVMGAAHIENHEESLLDDDTINISSEYTLGTDVAVLHSGNSGVTSINFENIDFYLAYYPMESIPWTVVTVIEVDEILESVIENQALTSALSVTAKEQADLIASMTFTAIVIGVAISTVVSFMLATLYSNSISAPIKKLESGVRRMSKGELEYVLDIHTDDEIENLAVAFNNMTTDLKHYIDDLTSATAENEKITAELSIATQIQESMLPNSFPAFPDRYEFDIYASMEPAKEVGGDFYDFFMIDKDHLGMVIADVSGKGVPAALFMVVAKTLIKNFAQKGDSPAEILANANEQLCQNNDANMFLTAWIAILNVKTGKLVYANAGHNPPLIRQGDGSFKYLDCDPGFVLAGLEGMCFSESTLMLNPNDVIYLYTDGVTDAINITEEIYSEERLEATLNNIEANSLQDVLEGVKADVDCFVGDTPQFDDITMLILKFQKKNKK